MRLPDMKEILLAKHAQHVVIIHFPIALLLVGIAFDWLAVWLKKVSFAAASYYNLSVAALFAVPTIATGVLAWQWQLDGARLKGTLLLHLILALASGVLIFVVWFWHFRLRRNAAVPPVAARIAVEILAVALITVTAHLGGIVSGVNAPL